MAAHEEKKVPVVVEADTVVDPHTVVVKLLNANVAHAAVLRPCRLSELASLALIVLKIYQVVIRIAFDGFCVIRLPYNPRFAVTRNYEREITQHHDPCAYSLVILSYIGSGDEPHETHDDIYCKASNCNEQIHYLHYRVLLVEQICIESN